MNKIVMSCLLTVLLAACSSDDEKRTYPSTPFQAGELLGKTYKCQYIELSFESADSLKFRLYGSNYPVAEDSARAAYSVTGDTLKIVDLYPDSMVSKPTESAHLYKFVGLFRSNEKMEASFLARGKQGLLTISSGTYLMPFYRKDIWYLLQSGAVSE